MVIRNCATLAKTNSKERTKQMNVFGMVDVTLLVHDYVIVKGAAHYGRLHKLERSRGYWLAWGEGEVVTVGRIEEAVAAFERVTGELDSYQVQLAERRG